MQIQSSKSLLTRPGIAALAAALFLAGCAVDSEHRSRNTGAIIGAVAGAILGHNIGDGDTSDRVIGAAGGALIGAAVGDYMDDQRAELERELAEEQRRDQLGITEIGEDTLRIGIAGDATFEFDKATIQPQFKPTYDKIGSVLADYDKTVVHVAGHTDSVGSEDYNKQLSRARARSVGQYLREHGVDGNRIIYYGEGEMRPIASNETEEGRRRNRRVEIYIKPIVEGDEPRAYEPPPGIAT